MLTVGRQLLLDLGPLPVEVPLVMDRAYESDETQSLAEFSLTVSSNEAQHILT